MVLVHQQNSYFTQQPLEKGLGEELFIRRHLQLLHSCEELRAFWLLNGSMAINRSTIW
jgi:hypothetical protein